MQFFLASSGAWVLPLCSDCRRTMCRNTLVPSRTHFVSSSFRTIYFLLLACAVSCSTAAPRHGGVATIPSLLIHLRSHRAHRCSPFPVSASFSPPRSSDETDLVARPLDLSVVLRYYAASTDESVTYAVVSVTHGSSDSGL